MKKLIAALAVLGVVLVVFRRSGSALFAQMHKKCSEMMTACSPTQTTAPT